MFSLSSLIDTVYKILKTPLSIIQHISSAPETTAFKMTVKLIEHLSKTVYIKTEHPNLHDGKIYYQDRTSFDIQQDIQQIWKQLIDATRHLFESFYNL